MAAALIIGVGVPLLWIWLASKMQSSGRTGVDPSTAAVMLVGILVTYVAVLYAGGRLQEILGASRGDTERPPPVRHPWMRSMRDEPYRPGSRRLTMPELVLVWTAILATAACMVWFFFFAGSPLPAG